MTGFIRPEARDWLARHAVWLWPAAGLALGLWALGYGIRYSGLFFEGLGIALIAVTLALTLAWRQRARFRQEIAAPGLVEIDEARISYFAPSAGAVIDRDGLIRVQLASGGDGLVRWVLTHDAGPPVAIPLSAQGADGLVDLFAGLPGVEIGAALSALDRRRPGLITVWTHTDR